MPSSREVNLTQCSFILQDPRAPSSSLHARDLGFLAEALSLLQPSSNPPRDKHGYFTGLLDDGTDPAYCPAPEYDPAVLNRSSCEGPDSPSAWPTPAEALSSSQHAANTCSAPQDTQWHSTCASTSGNAAQAEDGSLSSTHPDHLRPSVHPANISEHQARPQSISPSADSDLSSMGEAPAELSFSLHTAFAAEPEPGEAMNRHVAAPPKSEWQLLNAPSEESSPAGSPPRQLDVLNHQDFPQQHPDIQLQLPLEGASMSHPEALVQDGHATAAVTAHSNGINTDSHSSQTLAEQMDGAAGDKSRSEADAATAPAGSFKSKRAKKKNKEVWFDAGLVVLHSTQAACRCEPNYEMLSGQIQESHCSDAHCINGILA